MAESGALLGFGKEKTMKAVSEVNPEALEEFDGLQAEQEEMDKVTGGAGASYSELHCPICKNSNILHRRSPADKEWYECLDCGYKWWPY